MAMAAPRHTHQLDRLKREIAFILQNTLAHFCSKGNRQLATVHRGTVSQLGSRKRESWDRIEQDAVREAVRLAREACGVNPRELSFRIGKHPSFVYRLEAGTRTLDLVEFLDIARALSIEPEALFQMVLAQVKLIVPNERDKNAPDSSF